MIYKIIKYFEYLINKYKYPIGKPTPYFDTNGKQLCVGDTIMFDGRLGIVLHNPSSDLYEAFLFYSQWYGKNKYNPYSYGKTYSLDCIKHKK